MILPESGIQRARTCSRCATRRICIRRALHKVSPCSNHSAGWCTKGWEQASCQMPAVSLNPKPSSITRHVIGAWCLVMNTPSVICGHDPAMAADREQAGCSSHKQALRDMRVRRNDIATSNHLERRMRGWRPLLSTCRKERQSWPCKRPWPRRHGDL